MKRLLLIFGALLCPFIGQAQVPAYQNVIFVSSAPAGACTNGSPAQIVISTGTLYSCQLGAWGQVGGTIGPQKAVIAQRAFSFVGNSYQFGGDNLGSAGTDISSGSRRCTTAENGFSVLRVIIHGSYNLSGTETNFANPTIWRYGLEYPVGSITTQMSSGGLTTAVLQPGAIQLWDYTGAYIPAGAAFCIRPYERVPTPPTSPSVVTSAVAGALTTSTTYFYKVTAIDNGLESGPSAEFSVATGATTSLSLSWTAAANATPSIYNIYRGTTTGAETFIASIPAPGTGWLDTGLANATSAKTPPAASNLYYSAVDSAGNSTTGSGGTAADTSGLTGQISAHVGPGGTSSAGNYVILGNDAVSHPVLGLGDSLQAGTGIVNFSSALASGDPTTQNWFNLGLPVGTWSPANLSIPSAKAEAFSDQTQNPDFRLASLAYVPGSQVVSNMGLNDLYAGVAWTTVANYKIALGKAVWLAGGTLYITTIGPDTTSTNNFLTVAGQTSTNAGDEVARGNYNTWIRTGMQVSAGTPCNTAACGTPTPYISPLYFDVASASGEVNNSGTPTLNGGFWPTGSTSFAGLILSGSPTNTAYTITTSPFTVGSLAGCLVQMTSGTQNGNTAVINIGTTANTLTLFANGASRSSGIGTFVGFTSTAAVAGDTFNVICPPTLDGVHPSQTGHTTIGGLFATWATANLVP